MSIVSPADFSGNNINIPNADDTYTGSGDAVQAAIDLYEPELLSKLFGSDLYSQYEAGLLLDPIPQKWVDLRDNKYVKLSILYYVYYNYASDNNLYYSGIGEQKLKGENSNNGSVWDRGVKVWNSMVKSNFEVRKFITEGDYDVAFDSLPLYVWELPFYSCVRPDIFMYKNTLDL